MRVKTLKNNFVSSSKETDLIHFINKFVYIYNERGRFLIMGYFEFEKEKYAVAGLPIKLETIKYTFVREDKNCMIISD